MKTLTIDIPDNIDVDEKEAKLIIASKLYENGKLSLGQAASLVNLTKRDFIELLGNYNVSLFGNSPKDLLSDLENA
jgi:predicted HTH domain antitoxin